MRVCRPHAWIFVFSVLLFAGCKWEAAKEPPPKTELETSDRRGNRTNIIYFGDGTTIRSKTTNYRPEEGCTLAMESETFRDDGTRSQSVRTYRIPPFSRDFKPPLYSREERVYDSSGDVALETRRYAWSSEQLIEVKRELARHAWMSLRFRDDGSKQQMAVNWPDGSVHTIFYCKDGATIHKEVERRGRVITFRISGRGEYREFIRETLGGNFSADEAKRKPYLVDTYKRANGQKMFEQAWYQRSPYGTGQFELGEVKIFGSDGSVQKRIRLYRQRENPAPDGTFSVKEVEVLTESGRVVRAYDEEGLLTSQITYNKLGKPVKEEIPSMSLEAEGLTEELFRQTIPLGADEQDF